ncbi:unnamed protein product [Ilex paraguariensis]|uniref:RING-type E3 ubiquitin transferase n=1 Tax=Ilex paraguariensis TaxID=185542 RepID=A0ABC8QZ19_9AQUA
MAKTAEKTTGVAKATTELKRELQRLVNAIVDDDDYSEETTDQAMMTLYSRKKLIWKRSLSLSLKLDSSNFPDEFKCPLSKALMKDPVILATGQTYDRLFIENWLKYGKRICPQTQQVLSYTVLTPNCLVREMISQWCKKNDIELPNPAEDPDEELITDAERGHLNSLLQKLSSSLSDQQAAAKELRLLTKDTPHIRALFGQTANALFRLLKPLSPGRVDCHPDLQEDLITTVLNVSIHDSNKKLVADNPVAIPLLIESLKFGNMDTRSNAAAALLTLSDLDSNKRVIGKSGALKPLIDLLEEGHLLAMKDAASAIFSLCLIFENNEKAVYEGAVRVIFTKIMGGILIDELLAVLALLSRHERAVEQIGELDAVPSLLSILRENTNERIKENCIAILYKICSNDRTKLREIKGEENANGTISMLAQSGTLKARRKANSILDRLTRAASRST